MKKLMFASAVVAAIIVTPLSVHAAPKSGCPAAAAGWQTYSVDALGTLLFEKVGAWDTVGDAIAEIDQRFDRNDDDGVCLATRWEDANPKSNLSGFTLYLVADNNANAPRR